LPRAPRARTARCSTVAVAKALVLSHLASDGISEAPSLRPGPDALLPYEQRVDHALQTILTSRSWTTPQRQWLQKIAAQTNANVIVDRAALDDPDLVFKREGGGFVRLDRIFGGELQQVLDTFNESLWPPAA
jgi:hypothetical protein